ncbi:pantetheine-phosphate adenylyltransferase [Pseudaquidulcibacter saccharophilus]|uniref:pantetheine-phosphate adenylyltransferase n=1 Tax=Pseudaquidulcibacter saccharophilus TaxID=2831900 RepID=UPI001EFEFF69|nr:pantetheine-phosphate adenylyltransferase [Pseudaquidulcibacter saccharophilus]
MAKLGEPRVGLYPGTFDPITFGHLDIIRRAVKIFDELVIGVAVNRDKGPLFTLEERVAMVENEIRHIRTDAVIRAVPMDGLLMQFAVEHKANCIVRGLRAVADFEYEFQMVGMNQKLNSDIETVFFMAAPQHQAIASRLVKEIYRLGGEVEKFVPDGVKQALKEKLGDQKQK